MFKDLSALFYTLLHSCFPVKGSPGGWSLWTLQRVHHQGNVSLWKDTKASQMINLTRKRRSGRNYRYVSARSVSVALL